MSDYVARHNPDKIKADKKQAILDLWREGVGPMSIAVRLSITHAQVLAIVNPRHLSDEFFLTSKRARR